MKKVIRGLLPGVALLIFASFINPIQAQEQKKEKEKAEESFVVVEDMPKFQNGDLKKFTKWVGEQVKYPPEALKDGIAGKVICQFDINKKGEIKNIKVIRSVDKLLDAEVVRVVKSSPKWTPGRQRGKDVQVQMAVPVWFKVR